ncbi:unnamed protein product [Dovyalis caffra]|uniref:Pectinesterase inhibitor domain-containing protein n=1 Tax=Dovyalis caffra TaxID=77055 RepID=A0AAV1QQB2_9ROSI|nr:unnamed protein product [Dovyalis caffra]
MTQAGHYISISEKNKRLILAIFASFLLVGTIIAIVAGVNSHKNSTKNAAAHALLMASCSSTRYPDLCYSTLASVPGVADNLAVPKDVILLSINSTRDAIKRNIFLADKCQATSKRLTEQQKTALADCMTNYNSGLADLDKVSEALAKNDRELLHQQQYADDLKTQPCRVMDS